jgi:hypothetical protein
LRPASYFSPTAESGFNCRCVTTAIPAIDPRAICFYVENLNRAKKKPGLGRSQPGRKDASTLSILKDDYAALIVARSLGARKLQTSTIAAEPEEFGRAFRPPDRGCPDPGDELFFH